MNWTIKVRPSVTDKVETTLTIFHGEYVRQEPAEAWKWPTYSIKVRDEAHKATIKRNLFLMEGIHWKEVA